MNYVLLDGMVTSNVQTPYLQILYRKVWSFLISIYTKLKQHMFLIPLTPVDNTLNLYYLACYFPFHGWVAE